MEVGEVSKANCNEVPGLPSEIIAMIVEQMDAVTKVRFSHASSVYFRAGTALERQLVIWEQLVKTGHIHKRGGDQALLWGCEPSGGIVNLYWCGEHLGKYNPDTGVIRPLTSTAHKIYFDEHCIYVRWDDCELELGEPRGDGFTREYAMHRMKLNAHSSDIADNPEWLQLHISTSFSGKAKPIADGALGLWTLAREYLGSNRVFISLGESKIGVCFNHGDLIYNVPGSLAILLYLARLQRSTKDGRKKRVRVTQEFREPPRSSLS